MPSDLSCSYASTQSEHFPMPVPMRITSGLPPSASASTYAPRCKPSAGAYLVRSKVGTAWQREGQERRVDA